MKEAPIQKAILKYLNLKKHFHYRNNSGAFKAEHGGFYHFGSPGSPDIICCINGQMVGIEVKAPGGRQSDSQKVFQADLTKAGGKYILAHSLDDILTAGL